MDLYITVGSDKVITNNGIQNKAIITVDLESLWRAIEGRFTYIHLDLLVSIPVISDEIHPAKNPTLTMQLAKDVAVNEIKDYKVIFEANYSATDDTERQPYGVAYLRGYQLLESMEG